MVGKASVNIDSPYIYSPFYLKFTTTSALYELKTTIYYRFFIQLGFKKVLDCIKKSKRTKTFLYLLLGFMTVTENLFVS